MAGDRTCHNVCSILCSAGPGRYQIATAEVPITPRMVATAKLARARRRKKIRKRLKHTQKKWVIGTEPNIVPPTGTKTADIITAVPIDTVNFVVATKFSREMRNAMMAPSAPPGTRNVMVRIMVMVAATTMRATIAPRPGYGVSSPFRNSQNQLVKFWLAGAAMVAVAMATSDLWKKTHRESRRQPIR